MKAAQAALEKGVIGRFLGEGDESSDEEVEGEEYEIKIDASEPLGLELEERLGSGKLLRVKRVIQGGQAELDGRVSKGDCVKRIGEVEVAGEMASFEAALTLARSRFTNGPTVVVMTKCVLSKSPPENPSLTPQKLKKKLERYEEALLAEREAVEASRSECERLAAEAQARATALSELEDQLRDERSTARSECERLEAELSEARSAAAFGKRQAESRSREDIRNAELEVRRLELREKELEAAVRAAESARDKAEATQVSKPDLSPQPEIVRQLEVERVAAADQRRTSAAAAAALRADLEAARSRSDDLQALNEDLQHRLHSLESALNKKERQTPPPTDLLQSLQARLDHTEAEARRHAQRALEASNALDEARAEKTLLQKKLTTKDQRLSALNQENTDLELRLSSLKSTSADLKKKPAFSSTQTHHKLKRLMSYDGRRVSNGLFAALLTLLDDAGLALAALLRSSPVVRCACIIYLALLHLYTFVLVTAKATALAFSEDDAAAAAAGSPSVLLSSSSSSSRGTRLRGRGA